MGKGMRAQAHLSVSHSSWALKLCLICLSIFIQRDHVASDLSSSSCFSHVGSLCTCNLKTVLDSVCPYFDLESDIKSTQLYKENL